MGGDQNQQLPLAQPPPASTPGPRLCTARSIQELLVVLAVITLVGVVAGIMARVCGGRHLVGSGDPDVEGWVEQTCRSCIDGGVSQSLKDSKPEAEQAKK
ncbi:hypothetical protein MLD38_004449 [Melastoma candidum]|uniref:Uncharacterized protein n=1 Tax=Melastoma candidum TaxID=119954 RepID=A0ACB9S4Y0_9MYRT|nr:hypothetical protein MLD38_004449 [Melastoma candidum]